MLKSINIEFKVFGLTASIRKKDTDKINKNVAKAIETAVLDNIRKERRQGGLLRDD